MTKTSKNLKAAFWWARYSAKQLPRYSNNPRARAFLIGVHDDVLADIEREIEIRNKPVEKFQEAGASARRETGKTAAIIAAYHALHDRNPRDRAAIIAQRLGVSPQYVRRIIRVPRLK